MTPVANCENLWLERVTIPSGGNACGPFLTEGRALVGVLMPAGWDAAKLGFEASVDGSTFGVVYTSTGALAQGTAAASQFVGFPSPDAIFAPHIEVKSVDAADVAVNQTADRVLTLLFRRFLGGA